MHSVVEASTSGDVGSPPKVTWKTGMDAGKVETKTITEGDGDELKGQDGVLAHIWIGNGYSKQKEFSTYDNKKAELLASRAGAPEFEQSVESVKEDVQWTKTSAQRGRQ